MTRSSSRILLFAIVGAVLISGSLSANILGVFTSLSPSHLIVQLSTAKVLAENGHNVTVITALKPPITHKNFNIVRVPLSDEDQRTMTKNIGIMAGRDNSNPIWSLFLALGNMNFMFDKMRDVMMDQRVKDLYENKDNKFDLVLMGFFMNDYQFGIARKLNVPIIVSASMNPNMLFDSILGNPSSISYVPTFSMDFPKGQSLTFMQRIKNILTSIPMSVFLSIIQYQNAKTYEKLYGNDANMPAYKDLAKNVSLIFFSSHALSEGPIQANVPSVIEVGGIQVKDKPDPLPKEVEAFLKDAPNGAILLSLGSNVKGDHLKPETVQKMFNVLSKLKQKVIWKWENPDKTPGKSDNILYSKWLPQDDILAHPKLVLFITHAGKGGITEAQYHGKPMLALPVFGDQPSNAAKMVKTGFGLSLSVQTLEEQAFDESIQEILKNPQYADKVKKFSALYRDRPMTARQSVLYWTEYVLRHHGAPHMQSPLVHMNFITANNLDVYATFAIIFLIFGFVSKIVLTFIYRKCKGKPKKVKKTKTH